MKQEFKIFTLATFVLIVLCGIMVLQAAAQEARRDTVRPAEGQINADQNTAIRNEIENLRNAADQAQADGRIDEADNMRAEAANLAEQLRIENQQRRQDRQLREIDAEIERLRQMMLEAEEIRANIARQAGEPEPQEPILEMRQIAVQPGTAARRGAGGQNVPVIPRPGVRAVIDNIPQMIDQLRNAVNNNVERILNAYDRIQQRMANLEAENQRLQDENRDLRNQNQQLRARLQEREPRRPSTGQGATDTFERP